MQIGKSLELSTVASLLDVLPDAIIWVHPVFTDEGAIVDFKVTYSNKPADEVVQHPRGSLTGLRILGDGVPSREGAEGNFRHFLEVYQTGEPKERSFYAHHSGQHIETYRRTYEGGVLSITRDRRAQREAERKEKEKTQLLNGIVNHAPVGIAVYETVRNEAEEVTDFKIKLYNDIIHQLTGVSKEEREKLSFRELLKMLKSEDAFDRYRNVVETGEPISFEFKSLRIQGWLLLSVVKLLDGFLVMVSDITHLKNLQSDLENSAHRFQTVVNNSRAGIFTLSPIKDEKGDVIEFRFGIVNQAVASYVGQPAEALVGEIAGDYFQAYKTNGLFEAYKDTYLTGKPKNFEFHYEDGYDIFFNISAVKMNNEVLVTFTDHTVLKRLQRELESKIEELKRSNASLEEFAYAASHDLQEPLRKIHTFSDKLRRDLHAQLSPEQQRLFERIESATHRMRNLIDDLLAFSQVSTKKNLFEPVELSRVLETVLQDLETSISETGAVIQSESLPCIRGDERQLRQLFQNLIGNAIKYRKADVPPQICIRCRKLSAADKERSAFVEAAPDREYYLIEIRDNGIGFEQQYAESIFQVFQRLHGKTEYEGTGIGLAIVQQVVQNHGGAIKAEGIPSVGATFKVLLPP